VQTTKRKWVLDGVDGLCDWKEEGGGIVNFEPGEKDIDRKSKG